MGKKILLLIRSDPRKSALPAEAVRIGLGLASAGHVLEIVLSAHAPLLLTESPEDIVDGEQAMSYLETLRDYLPVLSIEKREGKKIDPSESPFKVDFVSKEMLAKRLAASQCFLAF
ncbi:MAG: hypothetical protein ACE5GK_09535 [Nitrospiria bacterium]